MIREDFYVLGVGRHIENWHCSMMRLRHELVIRQFYIYGGGRSSFLEVVTRSGKRPGVGRACTIDGRVIMFLFEKQTYTVDLNNCALLK